jgi:uncharacterized protein YdaU (DUF1376 family)
MRLPLQHGRTRHSMRVVLRLVPGFRRARDCAPYLTMLLLCAAQKAGAQLAPADDFFHRGAQFYISNNVAQAKAAVDTGLKLYPDDEKLKKLDELLKQQSQQQAQQNQKDQQQQQQSQKDQQNQKPQDQSQQQQKSPEQQKQDQKKEEPPKQQEQQKASPGKKDGEKPKDQKGEGQPAAPDQMTPEEAKRLLDVQKGDEQLLQLKPQGKPHDSQRPVKDW